MLCVVAVILCRWQSSVSSLGLSVSMPGPLDESTFEQFAPFVLDVGEATKNLYVAARGSFCAVFLTLDIANRSQHRSQFACSMSVDRSKNRTPARCSGLQTSGSTPRCTWRPATSTQTSSNCYLPSVWRRAR